ncbi:MULTISPECIES: hypothetical protein [Fictibacillus]|uniref:hypothetical protein n=1 Tax=Fictibacillus TaxID=1329200 RepID=UPI001029EBF5|nr:MULTISPECIES: hypothetical protein [Fictibacillus]RZT23659.1 hypothetical protein EV282_2754 [Fictibacillus sp. BK138]
MKSRKLHHTFDKNVDDEIEELEQEIGSLLDEYDVEFPGEEQIMMTIDAMKPHVPVRKNRWREARRGMTAITKQAYKEVFYMSSLFWIANGLLIAAALSGVLLMQVDPYAMVMMFAPITMIMGLIEVLKSRNAGMAELEMSYKYNFQEIMLSKMLVVGGFNLVVNLLITVSLGIFHQEVLISKMLLYWITPFTFIAALSLFFVSRYRQIYAITAGMIIWLTVSGFLSQPRIIEKLESLPAELYVTASAVALILSLFKAVHIYKRGVLYEVNH